MSIPSPSPTLSRVLLVEDDDQVRTVISRWLQSMGFDVITAVDGTEALRLAEECSPDLVVSDVMLPGPNGLEVMRILRKRLPRLRFLAISGGGPTAGLQDCLDAASFLGANMTLAKPFSKSDLTQAVLALAS